MTTSNAARVRRALRRNCADKTKRGNVYCTPGHAAKAAEHMNRDKSTTVIAAYRCGVCGKYHTGR